MLTERWPTRDPLRMCQFMLRKVQERGGHYHGSCTVEHLIKDGKGNLSAVKLNNGESIACNKLIFSSGSWTPRIFKTLFVGSKLAQRRIADIGKLAGHAIIVKSPHWKSVAKEGRFPQGCHAVFATSYSGSEAVTRSKSFAPVSRQSMYRTCGIVSDIVDFIGDLLPVT